ncbi:Secreted RxLR effector peptide protein [Phytophthora palmivora]|uniref:Secreted RxLR effector peptide protein n=1 Tax=Phytophthora palmivora TaxID=4796 RepID=A0A2P4Y8H1_9STRA|nr:Secreted RxLR effector peptide protein [Phytophthora palmivora]
MHIFQVLLVTILACSEVILVTPSSERAQISVVTLPELKNSAFPGQRRSLRSDKSVGAEDQDLEEKGFIKYLKVQWWLETGKSDDHVRKVLKLNGLDDATMKTRPNYKYYEYFARKSVDYELSKWFQKQYTTFNVWTKLGFQDVTLKTSDDLLKLLNTANGKIYKRYVNGVDYRARKSLYAGYKPSISIDSYATEAEMIARTTIMANAEKNEAVAKVLLGLTVPGKPFSTLKNDALQKHRGYTYFEYYEGLRGLKVSDKKNFEKLFQTLKTRNAATTA